MKFFSILLLFLGISTISYAQSMIIHYADGEKSFIKTISTKFKNIDPSIFKLNKEYYFQFNTDNSQYLEYNGQYKLTYLNITFNKSDEEIFENVIEAKFTRA